MSGSWMNCGECRIAMCVEHVALSPDVLRVSARLEQTNHRSKEVSHRIAVSELEYTQSCADPLTLNASSSLMGLHPMEERIHS